MTIKHINVIKKCALVAAGFLLPATAFASINYSGINSMLENLARSYPALRHAVCAFAYLSGFILIVKSVHRLRAYGQVRTMMPSHAEFVAPMTQFFLAIILLALPTTIQLAMTTLWGYHNPLSYNSGDPLFGKVTNAVYGLIQILGLIALVRGLLIMARSAQKGAPPGQFGKGLTHTIGGILAVNIVGLIDTLKASVGY